MWIVVPLCECSITRWDGWDAMLIGSRRPKTPKLNVRDNKRKRREASSTKKKTFKVLQEYYHLQGLDKERLRDVMESVTSSVACIAQHFTSLALSGGITDGLDVEFNIHKRLFKSVVNFILDVFDLLMENENVSLYKGLFPTKVDHDPIRSLKEAVEKLSTGQHLDNVCHLREHEVGDVLRQHLVCQKYFFCRGGVVSAIEDICISYSEVSDHHRRWTRKVMKSYIPLKEDIKVQLTLELMKDKCYYVMDALYVEMMRSVNFNEVVQCVDDSSVNYALDVIVTEIIEGITCHVSFKKDLLLNTEERALFPLICGIFLPCERDVIEVVKIANHERRMQNHRFISLGHILCGLSMTKYARDVKKIFSNYDVQERAEFPIYRIYQRADMIAQKKIDKVVKLEDLAEAVFCEAYRPHPGTRLSFSDLTNGHNFSEGSNNRDQLCRFRLKKQSCGFDVEHLWAPLLTVENLNKVFREDNSLFLAKLLDKNLSGGFSMPKIRQSVAL
ncbi:hypothetical protein Leryth_006904 [Lithospermum erythrorhizon]|nr:hypothetical protein Leryth_006904 [Lithospermum erythrorhizon]